MSGDQPPTGPGRTRTVQEKDRKMKTGYDAIEAKEQDPAIVLSKYADPVEGAREDISLEEAVEIAKEDPSLIYGTKMTETPNGNYQTRFDLKITTTIDSFDPADTATDVEASREAYQSALTDAIQTAYPNADITHYDSTDEYGAPTCWDVSFDDDDMDGPSEQAIAYDLQTIMETVYETGNFWC